MKTLFTFLFILTILISSYAQKATFASLKAGTVSERITDPEHSGSVSIDKVYPNPAKDLITLELQSAQPGTIQVTLINILGTEVKKWDEFYLNEGEQKLRLDLSEFKSGVYILKIVKQNQVRTQVIKKN